MIWQLGSLSASRHEVAIFPSGAELMLDYISYVPSGERLAEPGIILVDDQDETKWIDYSKEWRTVNVTTIPEGIPQRSTYSRSTDAVGATFNIKFEGMPLFNEGPGSACC